MMRFLAMCVAITLCATGSAAQTFRTGDMLLGGCCGGYPTNDARLLVLRAGNSMPQQILTDSGVGYLKILTDRAGFAYILRNFDIQKVDGAGNVLATWPQPFIPYSGVLRSDNSMIVTHGNDDNIETLDSTGNVLASFDSFGSQGQIDLASDQCTLYRTAGNYVERYDVCSGVRLSDLPAFLPPVTTDLRILPNGDLLVAAFASGFHVYRISPAGAIVRDYPVDTSEIAVSVDGTSFWSIAHDGSSISEIDLNSGTVRQTISVPQFHIRSVAIVGEARAALPPVNVPALSRVLLATLAMLLAAIAIVKTR
jgi:hypothetical protein